MKSSSAEAVDVRAICREQQEAKLTGRPSSTATLPRSYTEYTGHPAAIGRYRPQQRGLPTLSSPKSVSELPMSRVTHTPQDQNAFLEAATILKSLARESWQECPHCSASVPGPLRGALRYCWQRRAQQWAFFPSHHYSSPFQCHRRAPFEVDLKNRMRPLLQCCVYDRLLPGSLLELGVLFAYFSRRSVAHPQQCAYIDGPDTGHSDTPSSQDKPVARGFKKQNATFFF